MITEEKVRSTRNHERTIKKRGKRGSTFGREISRRTEEERKSDIHRFEGDDQGIEVERRGEGFVSVVFAGTECCTREGGKREVLLGGAV